MYLVYLRIHLPSFTIFYLDGNFEVPKVIFLAIVNPYLVGCKPLDEKTMLPLNDTSEMRYLFQAIHTFLVYSYTTLVPII